MIFDTNTKEIPDNLLPGQYAKAVHAFMMVAAKGSVSKAPLMRSIALMDLREKRLQLRQHIEHLMQHPEAALSEKDREKLARAGVRGAKRVPTMKEFARMLASLDSAASLESSLFDVEISVRAPRGIVVQEGPPYEQISEGSTESAGEADGAQVGGDDPPA